MNALSLRVRAPVCSFRKAYAREFLESERVPPPATVFGFLLSLVGEEDRWAYAGERLAMATLRNPEVSLVLRTAWRVKSKKHGPGLENNRRPDFQEILTGVEFVVWVAEGNLCERLRAIAEGTPPMRFGGLSLGESRDLVDEIHFKPELTGVEGQWLVTDEQGTYPLPLWVDHVGSKGTRWGQFRLQRGPLNAPEHDDPRWIRIRPPET